jgi:RNA polymerase sigma factor (sigma-70 family)
MAETHPSPVLRHIHNLIGGGAAARLTDGQLLERFLTDRDEEAVAVLVRRYGPLVLGVCRRVLHNTHAAEDAFQATFLVLIRKAHSLDRSKPLGSWLYTVAYRLALRARANEVRRREGEAEAAACRAEPAETTPSDLVVAVEEELQRLPERHRVPLVLCYLEGKTNEQAAQVLGCPRGSMSWRLNQARDLLRQRLLRRGLVYPAGALAALLTAEAASAAVPLPLLHNTVRAGLWFAAEEASTTAFVSTQALTLAQGALKSMLVHKLKIIAGLLLALGLLGTSATLLVRAAYQAEPAVPPDQRPPQVPAERAEVRQEGLPAGALARLGTTELRHGDGIFFAAYTPDGKRLLTAGKDKKIRLWDLATRKELRCFDRGEAEESKEPDAPEPGQAMDRRMLATLAMAFQVSLSPDGEVVAANRGGTILLWATATGEKLREWDTGQKVVALLRFSADSKSVLSLGTDGSLAIWEVATGKGLKHLAGGPVEKKEAGYKTDAAHLSAVSPGFKYLAWQHVDTTAQSSVVKILDLETGKELAPIKTQIGGAYVLAFSPDDKTLAVFGFVGGITLWDVAAGKELGRLGGGAFGGIAEPATTFAFSPDGKTLAVTRSNGTIELWDLVSLKRTRTIGEVVTDKGGGMMILLAGFGAMARSALAYSPDGQTLTATLGGAMVRQFNVQTGEEIPGPAGGHRNTVAMVGLAADGESLLTYSYGDPVRVWDLVGGRQRREVPIASKATNAAFSASGRLASVVGKTVTVSDADGKEVRKVEKGKLPVLALALSPDGTVLATRNVLSPEVHLWDLATGKERATLAQAGEAPKGTGLSVSETAGVVPPDLVFSPDGRYLAGAGAKRQLCLWDVAAAAPLWELAPSAGQTIERFAFSTNSRCLATRNADGTVRLYETTTGEQRAVLGQPLKKAAGSGLTVSIGGMSIAFSQQRDNPVCLAFSPDGRYLATTKDTPDIHLWDVLAGREVGKLTGHQGGVVSLLFTPDGKRLISGSTDTTALTWDVTRLTKREQGRPVPVDGPALEALWGDLAARDASRAFDAFRKLCASPDQATALIKDRVHPASVADNKRLAQLISDLESKRFEVRRKAEVELEGLGDLARPELQKALNGEPPLVLRQRVSRLLEKLSGQTSAGGMLRELRAVELLELLGSPEARQELQSLSQGAPDARLTREAKEAVERLTKRAALAP